MPISKNAYIRYRTIDSCLRNVGRKYTKKDLLYAVNEALEKADPNTGGINHRQLGYDISFMKSEDGFKAPIEHFNEGKTYYYKYGDNNYSFESKSLNKTETEQIANALNVLNRFSGNPAFIWVEEVMLVLKDKFNLENANKKVIAFSENLYYVGNDFIAPLFNAIVNRYAIALNYKTFSGTEIKVSYSPSFLKQYNNRWFVFGCINDSESRITNYALDRIENVKQIDDAYLELAVNWEEYFDDFVGVSKAEGDLQKVKLWVSPKSKQYVQTKPLHSTQRTYKQEDGSLIITIEVIPNYELETMILGYGENIKVLAPESFRSKLKDRLNKSYLAYAE